MSAYVRMSESGELQTVECDGKCDMYNPVDCFVSDNGGPLEQMTIDLNEEACDGSVLIDGKPVTLRVSNELVELPMPYKGSKNAVSAWDGQRQILIPLIVWKAVFGGLAQKHPDELTFTAPESSTYEFGWSLSFRQEPNGALRVQIGKDFFTYIQQPDAAALISFLHTRFKSEMPSTVGEAAARVTCA